MKKIESYLPLKAVELANKKLPEIWDAIEKTRMNMLPTSPPLWREDIYIPSWQIYEETFLNGPYNVEVYRFAPEMEELLYKQADYDLPLDTLLHLPFPCFYVETPNILDDKYHGFFISYDQEKDGTHLLRCMALKKEDTINFNISEIRLEEGITLKDGIAKAAKKSATEIGLGQLSAQLAEMIIYVEYWTSILSKLSQLLLYLTAQNIDLEELSGKGARQSTGKIIKDKYREIRNWDVGYRVVKKIEKCVFRIKSEDVPHERSGVSRQTA